MVGTRATCLFFIVVPRHSGGERAGHFAGGVWLEGYDPLARQAPQVGLSYHYVCCVGRTRDGSVTYTLI